MAAEEATTRPNSFRPNIASLKPHKMSDGQMQSRKISVPPHRYTPLKKAWLQIYNPIYEMMKINVRMNLKSSKVELKTRKDTPDVGNLHKCADFVRAFILGFDIVDACVLLKADEFYVESFEIRRLKSFKAEHLSRTIERLSGEDNKAKLAIENDTKTRIVIEGSKIHILGSFTGIKAARDLLSSLILVSPAVEIYSKL